ncbi:aminoglycoside phosphotransferase [Micromonospora rosaria]|uniref:Aminoglycoside phosphotransferase n=1 Tax=Micromonospora rosaria TaxID=47874 RepID=A0A136PPQ1_9ACTN|nr:TIGR02569 family protein [Micromonospora rosaria]KXK60317.1 aminoglycoside phosphotransferase [Micromonospora rosaria]
MEPATSPPPPEVLHAFGVSGVPVVLPGGKGGTWRVGDVVLKPSEGADESRWRAETLAEVRVSAQFRVPRPVPTADGNWLAAGWEAWRLVAGEPDTTRIDEVVRAGSAFHAAVAHLPRPAFLDARDDPWSYGDRVAWEEAPISGSPASLELLEPLAAARRPVHLPEQIVHGDLPGNVLFADGVPPAIIDWSPYWRPVPWAAAVAVVDALCWYGADPQVLDRWSHLPEWGQMLVRALIYRIVTRDAAFGPHAQAREPNSAYRPVVAMAIAAARHRTG